MSSVRLIVLSFFVVQNAYLMANEFPLRGEHLADSEYLEWQNTDGMFLITAVKPIKDGWKSAEGSKSKDALIFNKPVFAMSDGKVIACWRNANDNKVIGEFDSDLGIDSTETDTTIPQYGNHLWVEQQDGSRVLYAYLKEDTIPKSLCANDSRSLSPAVSAPDSPDVWGQTQLASRQQTIVKKGMLIGRVGNSGWSQQPQLGLKLEKNGEPQELIFDKGLFSMRAAQEDYIKWQPIESRAIPLAKAFFWPVRSQKADLPFTALPIEHHLRLLPWLKESGFAPVVSDMYTVGNRVFVNVSWQPSDMPWVWYGAINEQQHVSTMDQAFIEGYSLKTIDTVLVDGEMRYMTYYVQDLSPVLTQHAMTLADFNRIKYEAKKKGYGAAALSLQYINKEPVVTALFRPDITGEQEIYYAVHVDKLEEYVAKAKKKKLYMSTINAVDSHLGKMVSVIFSQRMATKNNEYDMDKGDVDDGHEKAEEEGWISGAISGFSQAKKKHRFVGYWQKGN